MAITDNEKKQIVQEVLAQMKSSSQGVNELQEVTTLDGVKSLPAMKGTQVVVAPVSLLSKPATDAASTANTAASAANTAANNANQAITNTNRAITKAEDATEAAKDAAKQATDATAQVQAAIKAAGKHPVVLVNDLLGTPLTFNTWQDAKKALDDNGVAYELSRGGLLIFRGSKGWEAWQFIGDPNGGENLAESWQKFSGAGGSGSGFHAISKPQTGYHTIATAVAALAAEDIDDEDKPGMIITFEESAGKWADYRYEATSIADFDKPGAWQPYGGAGAIKQLVLNGTRHTPDESGEVSVNIDVPQVDETLNKSSDNAIQNGAVAAKFEEVEDKTLFDTNVIENDDNTVTVQLLNKGRGIITSFDLPAGRGGGGGDEGSTTKIVLGASTNVGVAKEGDPVSLIYTYDHQYSSGDDAGQSTGQRADITITIKRGSTTVFEQTYANVAKGTSAPIDITQYMAQGTNDIYVKAATTTPEGKAQQRQAYMSVEVVTLTLTSSYSLANKIAQGGYTASESVSLPYTIQGAGTKEITLYVDGRAYDTREVKKAGLTNGTFTIPMSTLTAGRHTLQMVAEREVEGSDLTLRSESIYIDILKAGSTAPFIGTMMRFKDGTIFGTRDHLTPTINTGQYEQVEFDFVVYDPSKTPADLTVWNNGKQTQETSVPRTAQVYTNRFTSQGQNNMSFRCGSTTYNFYIAVAASEIDIEEATADLVLKLTAAGRSNLESPESRATWTHGEVTTDFEGFDWQSNGWTGDALRLTNGASININHKPFAKDATPTGATYEVELTCDNITDRKATVMSCMEGGVGFELTAEEAKITTSDGTTVSTPFDKSIGALHVAFVVQPKNGTRLLELYVNGIRSSAIQYGASESLLQENPQTIEVHSDGADVDLRSIRIYDQALTDDECLNNFMVDRTTVEEMVTLWQKNDVMDAQGDEVDIDKLRAQGKGVMRIVGDIDLLNQTNNKKFEITADVYFYSPYGKEYDFILRNCGLRIQGTSSTTYPRKNYRIYADREGCELYVNGVLVESKEYAFKPGARPVKIWCLKADYSDSSSTHNTGAVRLINDVMKRCGWLTPPQAAGTSRYDVRIGVDGFPIDGFYDQNGDGTNKYLGKFNFNNEKAECHAVYGFEGIEGFNDEATLAGKGNPCICLEFLNNSKSLCLYTTADMTDFDDALEFRYPDCGGWAKAPESARTAIKRLWDWVDATADNPTKFAAEVDNYFNVNFLCAHYIFTDYFMAVDDRVKNMMLATWDGIHWYFLPYDWDTLFGERNDSVLKYDYTITEDSWDASISSYAFAGHDSVLWKNVRTAIPDRLRATAQTIRSNMSTAEVLEMFNVKQMGNWSERIYNKDGYFKYIQPLVEGVSTTEGQKIYDYLYALQGSRYAHRVYTIQNRFALLDAQYVAGTYRSDSFTAYFGYKFSQSPRRVRLTSTERYYFGYGYSNGEPTVSAQLAAQEDSRVDLTLSTDLIVNDPQMFYGASRMKTLDFSNISLAIVNTLNLNNCTALRTLNLNCNTTQTTLNSLIVSNCKMLRELYARGMRSTQFTNLDLTGNTKLETLDVGNTTLRSVNLAKGAPLTTATLPDTLQSLELQNLNRLTNAGLTLEGTDNVNRIVIDGCALLDWQQIVNACENVRYLRITGINMTDDGTFLRSLMGVGGVDEDGANTDTCRLVGNCRLTRYLDDEEFAAIQAHFPELNIKQPEYTVLKQREDVADGTGWTNLDNKTGYDYDTEFVFSGHVAKILGKRHRCNAKHTGKGEVTIFFLHDENSNYYADAQDYTQATPAILTGAEGDVMVFEPHFWYKGVNDLVRKDKYKIYASGDECPATPQGTKVQKEQTTIRTNYAARVSNDYGTESECLTAVNNYSTVAVNIPDGTKQARFPGVVSAVYGGVFLDAQGNILGRVKATSDSGLLNGMYVFDKVPEGAVKLLFTISTAAPFDYVWFTPSEEIADIEPDWVEHTEMLAGVYEGRVVDDDLRSISGVQSSASITQPDFVQYAKNHGDGYNIVDWEWHKDTCNLFYAKYGKQDSQGTCGYGTNANGRQMGLSNAYGMQDTHATNAVQTNYTAYMYDEEGKEVNISAPTALGYENLWGNKAEWILDMYNVGKVDYAYQVHLPDGTMRELKGLTTGGDMYPMATYNGRYMDVWVTLAGGSTSTYYFDNNCISGATNRVVYRSYDSAGASGGVAVASASYDSASVAASIGSRLAFRGKIIIARSAAAFKAIVEYNAA